MTAQQQWWCNLNASTTIKAVFGLILCTLFFLLMQEVEVTQAANPTLQLFYALTQNTTTKNTTIWKIDFASSSRPIYRLSSQSTLAANELFSAHELAAIDMAISQGLVPDNIKSQTINQSMQKIWVLDVNRVLSLIRNGYCFTLSERMCFGYYEFLLIDTQIQSNRSLFKIDFNDSLTGSWGSCSGYPVAIESATINPAYDQVSIALIPEQSCTLQNNKLTQTLVIDFTNQKTVVNWLPLWADQPVWSPDGNKLAYITTSPQCPSTGCRAEINIYDLQSSQSIQIATSSALPVFNMFTVWRNPQSVLYRWYSPVDSFSGNPVLTSYNLETAAKQEWVLPDEQFIAMWMLGQTTSNFVSYSLNKTIKLLSIDDRLTVERTIDAIESVFYNNRYPDTILLKASNSSPKSFITVDSSLAIHTIDLSNNISTEENIIDLSLLGQNP